MISNCLILLALVIFLSFGSFAYNQNEDFANNQIASNLVGKTPYYRHVYQPGENTGKDQYKNTNTYYYTPYVTHIPKQYQSIYQAKNFWPLYTAPGEDPENRLAWVKDAPYYGKWHLPIATECPDRIRNFDWLANLPMPPKNIPVGLSD